MVHTHIDIVSSSCCLQLYKIHEENHLRNILDCVHVCIIVRTSLGSGGAALQLESTARPGTSSDVSPCIHWKHCEILDFPIHGLEALRNWIFCTVHALEAQQNLGLNLGLCMVALTSLQNLRRAFGLIHLTQKSTYNLYALHHHLSWDRQIWWQLCYLARDVWLRA